MEKSLHLLSLKKGQRAIIEAIDDLELNLQLMGMGCIPGEEVFIERIAPLGDPIEINASGNHISIRKRDAGKILIKNQ